MKDRLKEIKRLTKYYWTTFASVIDLGLYMLTCRGTFLRLEIKHISQCRDSIIEKYGPNHESVQRLNGIIADLQTSLDTFY